MLRLLVDAATEYKVKVPTLRKWVERGLLTRHEIVPPLGHSSNLRGPAGEQLAMAIDTDELEARLSRRVA